MKDIMKTSALFSILLFITGAVFTTPVFSDNSEDSPKFTKAQLSRRTTLLPNKGPKGKKEAARDENIVSIADMEPEERREKLAS